MASLARSSSPYDTYENTRLQTGEITEYTNTYGAGPPPGTFDETTRLHVDGDAHLPPPSSGKAKRSLLKQSNALSAVSPRNDRAIPYTRFALRLLSLGLSASMVAVLAHTVATYQKTKEDVVNDPGEGIQMRVWMRNLKMKPTLVLLGVSSVSTFLGLLVLISIVFSKSMKKVTTLSNLVTALVSMIGVGLWLGMGAWYKSNNPLQYYTCGLRNNKVVGRKVNMGSLCIELKYAFYVMLVMGIVELLSSLTVSWAMIAARRKAKYSRV